MSVIIAMCLYALSMSLSPGPTTIIAMTTGVNHGFRQSFPFIIGATIGFATLLSVIGLGLGEFASGNEMFMNIMGYLGSLYICFMGYKIATSSTEIKEAVQSRPGFVSGAILQFVNAKAWIAGLAGISAFNLAGTYVELFMFVVLFNVVGTLCLLVWSYAGSKISAFLDDQRNLRIFNWIMGSGLILVAVYLILMQMGYI